MTFNFFSFHFIDIKKTLQGVPPIVENGEIVEVQVLEEGEIFDPQEVLDGLSQQWNKTLLVHLKPLQNLSWIHHHPPEVTPRSWVDSMEFEKGIHDPKSCSYLSKKTSRGIRLKFGEERKKEREGRKNLDKGNFSIQRKWEMELPKNQKGNACTSRKRRTMEERSLITWRGNGRGWKAP